MSIQTVQSSVVPNRLEGKVTIVTGGDQGIGRGIALRLAADVTHPDANKGHVVIFLSQVLSVPTEQIATIGDMPNDVPMFQKSGISIAMENASPDVQKQARFVTTSNEDEGFAKAMESFILGGGIESAEKAS